MSNFQKVVTRGLDSEDMLQLTGSNHNAGGRDKARNHRMAEKIGQETQPEDTHQGQHQPRHDRQQNGTSHVFRCTGLRKGCQGRCGHQGSHSNRAHRQCSAGAEDSVNNQGQDTGVQTHLGRQPGQQGIGQRLGDEHDGNDDRGHQITGGLFPAIFWGPIQNGQIAFKIHRESQNRLTGTFR